VVTVAFDLKRKLKGKYGAKDLAALEAYRGFAVQQFDVVSCQFAVHYFFKDGETLTAFAANVARYLAPGGTFFGTTMDGKLIHRELVRSIKSTAQHVEEKHDNRLMWSITKLYEGDFVPGSEFNLGKKTMVFMETINRPQIEYLCDLELLSKALADHDILPISAEEANAMYDVPGPFTSFESIYARPGVHAKYKLTTQETRFSFLNTIFIFKRKEKHTT
jgi:SAM-dependent methyltransferase